MLALALCLVRVAVGRARLAVLIRFSDMAAEQSGLKPIDYAVWRSYKSVCTTTTRSRTWKSCASVCRGGMGPSGSDWQRDQWMAQATDSLRCSRRRTFWTFTL